MRCWTCVHSIRKRWNSTTTKRMHKAAETRPFLLLHLFGPGNEAKVDQTRLGTNYWRIRLSLRDTSIMCTCNHTCGYELMLVSSTWSTIHRRRPTCNILICCTWLQWHVMSNVWMQLKWFDLHVHVHVSLYYNVQCTRCEISVYWIWLKSGQAFKW